MATTYTPSLAATQPNSSNNSRRASQAVIHNAPLPSGPQTTPSMGGTSPLSTTAWNASNLIPTVAAQTQPLTGASRLNALNKVMGTSYGKTSSGTGTASSNPGEAATGNIPAWLQTQIDQLKASIQGSVAPGTGTGTNSGGTANAKGTATAAPQASPLDTLKARILQQDYARQQALWMNAVYNEQRRKDLASYIGQDQFMLNRSMPAINPSGGWAGEPLLRPLADMTPAQQMTASPYLSPYSVAMRPSTAVGIPSVGPQYVPVLPAVAPSLPTVW